MKDKLDCVIELGRSGLLTTLIVKEHDYDVVEFTLKKNLKDENGNTIVDSSYRCMFSNDEFANFMKPLIDNLKVRFDNADSIQR